MQLVDDLPFNPGSGPLGVRPEEPRRINDAGRAVRSIRLEARGGVGVQNLVVIEAQAVEGPSPRRCNETGEVPVGLHGEMHAGLFAVLFNHDRNPASPGRPNADMYPRIVQNVRSDRETTPR
jgi:hypothetical protein